MFKRKKVNVGKRQLYRRAARYVEHCVSNLSSTSGIRTLSSTKVNTAVTSVIIPDKIQHCSVEHITNSKDNNCDLDEYSNACSEDLFDSHCSIQEFPSVQTISDVWDRVSNIIDGEILDEIEHTDISIVEEITDWALQHNHSVPHNAVTDLLHRLQKFHPELPLNRLKETEAINKESNSDNEVIKHSVEHKTDRKYYGWKQFKKLIYKNFQFSINAVSIADCFCFINSKVIQISNIVVNSSGVTFIVGKKFKRYSSLYDYPFPSSQLSIYIVEDLSCETESWPLNEMCGKCMLLKLDNIQVALPVIHTLL